jgi:hypothetical protein
VSDDFAAKVRSLHFARSDRPKAKKTVDVHDYGTVEVTTSDERQDVLVKPDAARVRSRVNEE